MLASGVESTPFTLRSVVVFARRTAERVGGENVGVLLGTNMDSGWKMGMRRRGRGSVDRGCGLARQSQVPANSKKLVPEKKNSKLVLESEKHHPDHSHSCSSRIWRRVLERDDLRREDDEEGCGMVCALSNDRLVGVIPMGDDRGGGVRTRIKWIEWMRVSE